MISHGKRVVGSHLRPGFAVGGLLPIHIHIVPHIVVARCLLVSVIAAGNRLIGRTVLLRRVDSQFNIAHDVVHLHRQRFVGIILAIGVEISTVGVIGIIRAVTQQVRQLYNVRTCTLIGTNALKSTAVKIHVMGFQSEVGVRIETEGLFVTVFHREGATVNIQTTTIIGHGAGVVAEEGTAVNDGMTVGGKDRIAVHTVKGVIGGIKGNASADLQFTVVIDNGAGIAAGVHAHVQRARAANSQAAAVVNETVKQIVDIRHADIDVGVNGQILCCICGDRNGAMSRFKIRLLFQRVEGLIRRVGKAIDQDTLNGGMLQCVLQFCVAAAHSRIVDGACACRELCGESDSNNNCAFRATSCDGITIVTFRNTREGKGDIFGRCKFITVIRVKN